MAAFPLTSNQSLHFWSSSPYAGNARSAWYVNFYGGLVYVSYRSDYVAVRLVREGCGVPVSVWAA